MVSMTSVVSDLVSLRREGVRDFGDECAPGDSVSSSVSECNYPATSRTAEHHRRSLQGPHYDDRSRCRSKHLIQNVTWPERHCSTSRSTRRCYEWNHPKPGDPGVKW